ncbi:MAG: hypothetical protein WC889_11145 [Myxococcota bacterium]
MGGDLDKKDEQKLASIRLEKRAVDTGGASKAPPLPSGREKMSRSEISVVRVKESEIGTEAPLVPGDGEGALKVDSPLYGVPVLDQEKEASPSKETPELALPLYRFDSHAELEESQKTRIPGRLDSFPPGVQRMPAGAVSIRKETVADRFSTVEKIALFVILLALLAAATMYGVYSHRHNQEREAAETERLKELTGKQ